ncbi:hypothetical protein SEA_LIGMA_28 [Gordonia phage Ligma]|nr:hypothetical protein SEA_LIGMA_28 [Gordonia phage Ligma]UQT02129.1 hypothetical protein SEA_AXUMITE_28 [Gordonia phage Axumite]
MSVPEHFEIVTAADIEALHAAPVDAGLWYSYADPTPEGQGRCVISAQRDTPPDPDALYLTGRPADEWPYWSDPQAAADYLNALILGQ